MTRFDWVTFIVYGSVSSLELEILLAALMK